MESLHLTHAHIHPEIEVFGNYQKFSFVEHTSTLHLKNSFKPIPNIPALMNLEFENIEKSGFRFQHETDLNDEIGTFKLFSFENDQEDGKLLFNITPSEMTFRISTRGLDPLIPSDFSTKSYVDSNSVKSITAGTGLYGGTISSPLHPSGTIGIADVGITAGKYSWPESLNINAQGQVIEAVNGVQPINTLQAGEGMVVTQGSGKALVSLNNTGVQTGWYNNLSGFLSATGRINNAISTYPVMSVAGSGSISSTGGQNPVLSLSNIDINSQTAGQLYPERIFNFPSDDRVFLRGDGLWTQVEQAPPDLRHAIGWLDPQKIGGYPDNNNVFLRGDGVWNRPLINQLGINDDISLGGYHLLDAGLVTAHAIKAETIRSEGFLEAGTIQFAQWGIGELYWKQPVPLQTDMLGVIANRYIRVIFNNQLIFIPVCLPLT